MIDCNVVVMIIMMNVELSECNDEFVMISLINTVVQAM